MRISKMPTIKIRTCIMAQLKSYFLRYNYEQGCLIGGSQYLNRIDSFSPVLGTSDQNHFKPDMDAVNRQIADWMDEGICLCGFIHSHPNGTPFLSRNDSIAIESWVRAVNLPFLCFGVAVYHNGTTKLRLYLAKQDDAGMVLILPMKKKLQLVKSDYITWRCRR